jgi:hypothetical protein
MILDVFRSDCFSFTSLTQSILKLPYKPSRIGDIGLFQEKGIPTLTATVEEKNGVLALLPTAERGTQATSAKRTMRKARSFVVPHIPYDDAILASDVQGVRAFGSENEVQTVAGLVNDRLAEMKQAHEVTLEWHRIGALHGCILDADASTVIYNLFNEFGLTNVSAPSGGVSTAGEFGEGQAYLTIDTNADGHNPGQHIYTIPFSDPTTNIRQICTAIARDVLKTLGMSNYDHLHCFCGAEFFDTLIDHDDVRSTYMNWFQAQTLRQDLRKGFEYGGITFENYQGMVSGNLFQAADEAIVFPVGVPNLFQTYYSPADFVETVNTIGLPLYAKQEPMKFNRGIELHTQSNPLTMCTRPLVLIRLKMS